MSREVKGGQERSRGGQGEVKGGQGEVKGGQGEVKGIEEVSWVLEDVVGVDLGDLIGILGIIFFFFFL